MRIFFDGPTGEPVDELELKRLTLVHNEQSKLLAAGLDRASTAFIAIGVVTPIATYVYGVAELAANREPLVVIAGSVAIAGSALLLHLLAHLATKGMVP